MIQKTSYSYLFLPDEDFGSEDDDLGADDGKADSDYESSQKSKKGKKAKPEKNKRAASKSRKRPAGKKKKKVASLCSAGYCTRSLLGDYRNVLIRLNVTMFCSQLSYSASILINFLMIDFTFVLPMCYLRTVMWSVFCTFIITW